MSLSSNLCFQLFTGSLVFYEPLVDLIIWKIQQQKSSTPWSQPTFLLICNKNFLAKKLCEFQFGFGNVHSIWYLGLFGIFMVFNALFGTRSLGALRAQTSRLRPFGPAFLGPSGLLDNVLHALWALRPCDPRPSRDPKWLIHCTRGWGKKRYQRTRRF